MATGLNMEKNDGVCQRGPESTKDMLKVADF